MGGMHRIGQAFAIAAVCGLISAAPAVAQTETQDTSTIPLTPTPGCSQADIDQLQRVITFVRSKSWAEQPEKTAFAIAPDTAACRVVLKINKVSDGEQAALERGGEGRLSIERTKDRAKPSRLPLLLWIVFGGAGLVFVFVRYGRR
jgi:hypothetical protein